MAKQHFVEVVMSEEERGERIRREVEFYQTMNLEPMPWEAVEAVRRKWMRKVWRKEMDWERHQRGKKEKEEKKKQEEARVIDRKKVYHFRGPVEEKEDKRRAEARRRSEFKKRVRLDYDGVTL